jgi:AcrR family transcriptional regulator
MRVIARIQFAFVRKTPRQARSRETVERIVAAARTVLVDDGYERFSTNRVAAAAGVSPGSLYQYFPDKQSVLDVVIDRYWQDLATRIEGSLGDRVGELSPGSARGVLDALLSALEADPVLLRVIVQELPQERLRVEYDALQRRIRDLATAALLLRGGAGERAVAATRAWVTVVAIEHLAIRWVLDGPPIPRDALLDETVTLVMGYLDRPG